jgi:hypothetical protein
LDSVFKVEGLGFRVWGLGMIVGDFVVRSRFRSESEGSGFERRGVSAWTR